MEEELQWLFLDPTASKRPHLMIGYICSTHLHEFSLISPMAAPYINLGYSSQFVCVCCVISANTRSFTLACLDQLIVHACDHVFD